MGTLTRRGTRQDEPPPPGAVVHLKKIKGPDRLSVVILSSTWEGFNTHYFNGRTQIHHDDKKLCEGCKLKRKLHWYGFIHVAKSDLTQAYLIAINNDGAARLIQLRGEKPSLRGMRVELHRENQYAKGTLVIDPLGFIEPSLKIPLPKSAIPTLERLWGCVLTD